MLLKQPRTFREAEEMARLACAVKTTMNNAPDGNMTAQIHNLSRSMDVPNSAILAKIEMLDEKLKQQKILAKPDPPAPDNNTLAKLDALVNGFTSEASVHQVEALLARIDQLEKAARKTEGSRVTPLAAYSAGSPETRDVFKEIRQIKDTLLDMIQNLDRRMDARINGLARRQQPNREAELPRQRTREGRPVCYSCGRVGHVQQNCNQRYSREANQNLISTNRTSSDVSRLIIIFQDLGINHSDVMDWLPWIQEFLIQPLLLKKLYHTATWHH